MDVINRRDIASRGLNFWEFIERIKAGSRFEEPYCAQWRGTCVRFVDDDTEEEVVDRYLANRDRDQELRQKAQS